MSRRLLVPALGLLLSLLLVAAACGGDDEEAPSPPPAAQPETPPTDAITIQIRTTSFPFSFQPPSIRFKPGQTYNLEFTVDDTFHTFTSEDLGIDLPLNPGEVVTHTLALDEPGSYEFLCTPHWETLGMKGVITVR